MSYLFSRFSTPHFPCRDKLMFFMLKSPFLLPPKYTPCHPHPFQLLCHFFISTHPFYCMRSTICWSPARARCSFYNQHFAPTLFLRATRIVIGVSGRCHVKVEVNKLFSFIFLYRRVPNQTVMKFLINAHFQKT